MTTLLHHMLQPAYLSGLSGYGMGIIITDRDDNYGTLDRARVSWRTEREREEQLQEKLEKKEGHRRQEKALF